MQLVSQISINLCDHNKSTNFIDRPVDGRTDGRSNDMPSQYRALHYSVSCGIIRYISKFTAALRGSPCVSTYGFIVLYFKGQLLVQIGLTVLLNTCFYMLFNLYCL